MTGSSFFSGFEKRARILINMAKGLKAPPAVAATKPSWFKNPRQAYDATKNSTAYKIQRVGGYGLAGAGAVGLGAAGLNRLAEPEAYNANKRYL